MATVTELQAEIARLRERYRIAQNGLANLNKSLQSNQAILARYTNEVSSIPGQIAGLESQINANQNTSPASAATSASEDGPQGPTKSPQAVVGPNGRITTSPDTTAPSNPIAPATLENAQGSTTGTDDPVRTTVQTQATGTGYNGDGYAVGLDVRAEDGTLSNLRKNPDTGELYDPGGTPGGVDLNTKPGNQTNEDNVKPSATTTQTATNAGDFKLVKVSPQPNVLDGYFSYSYVASVYLLNNYDYERLLQGEKKLDGYQLLFQSGGAPVSDGVIRQQTGSEQPQAVYASANRNPYFDNDFYLDSISLTSLLHGSGTGSAHSSIELKFTIIEPQGMTLLERLRDAVANYAPQTTEGGPVNYGLAQYLMVIRFYGYDKSGNIVQPIKGGLISAATTQSDQKAAVEKYIPFLVKNINWTVSSKTVSYEWDCAAVGQFIGGSTDRGTITADMQLNASTVELMLGGPSKYSTATTTPANPGATTTARENAQRAADEDRDIPKPREEQATVRRIDNAIAVAPSREGSEFGTDATFAAAAPKTASAAPTAKKTAVQGLMAALNDYQQQAVTDGKIEQADFYSIEFVGPEANLISGASVMPIDGRVNHSRTSGGQPANVDPNSLKQTTNSLDTTTNTFAVTAGMQIVQAIELVLRNSQYITQQSLFEFDADGMQIPIKDPNKIKNAQVKWYNITMSATRKSNKIDKKRNDFAYNIKYTVSPYLVKTLNSIYFPVNSFTGVHKSYPFWFTGQNTQVIDYQENLNILFRASITGSPGDKSQADRIKSSTTSNLQEILVYSLAARSAETSQQGDGKQNELTANAAEQLYDPASLREAKVKIIGDPAWIQQGAFVFGPSATYYGSSALTTGFNPDGSISYDNQDILFEVNWQPPEDYDLQTGLADPYSGKQSATQKAYNSKVSKISRVYRAIKVTSEFKQGKFEQELTGKIYPFVIPTAKIGTAKTPGADSAATAAATAAQAQRDDDTAVDADAARQRQANRMDAEANANRVGLAGQEFFAGRTAFADKAAVLGATGAYKEAQFETNAGGAAFGNPSITRQGITAGALQNSASQKPATDGDGNTLDSEAIANIPSKLPGAGRPITPGSLRDIQRQAQLARLAPAAGNPTSTTIPNNQKIATDGG